MKKWLIIWAVWLCSTSIFADSTFVSGTIVNETWTPANSPYCVVGDILISTLEIEPGVDVVFMGEYVFEVAGILTAVGTEQDSIKFTKADTAEAWQGIFFNFSQPGSELAYCVIDSSANRGILVDNSSPTIRNSIVRHNSSTGVGGGIRSNSPLTLIDCTIENNATSNRLGGGIYSEGPLSMTRCKILNNTINFLYSSNTAAGGGIYSAGGLTMSNCFIEGNLARSSNGNAFQSATAVGGGIYLSSDTLTLNNCIIQYNYAAAGANTAAEIARGGGIYMRDGTAYLTNCIVAYDSLGTRLVWGGSAATGGGIHVQEGNMNLTNCTIAYNEFDGIYRNSGSVEVKNTIVWENDNGSDQIIGSANVTYSDVQGGYSGIGNININPIFESSTCLNIVPGSPCIDAGDSTAVYNDICFPPSLGNARNDMGVGGGANACNWAIGCNPVVGIEEENAPIITQHWLEQNYPNPFNPSTTIRYQLSKAARVELSVFNMLGQHVVSLVNQEQPAGSYQVQWDGRNEKGALVSSGVYIYRLKSGSFIKTRKMTFLR